jgi:hypothetical protein
MIPRNESGVNVVYFEAVPDSGLIDLSPVAITGTFTDVSRGKSVTVSSTAATGNGGLNAVDRNSNTCWSSNATDREWISIDLGSRYYLNRIIVRWTQSYAKKYRIQVSDNQKRWTDLIVSTSDGGVDSIVVSGNGRYVRLSGMTRSQTESGYSICELEAFGMPTGGTTYTYTNPSQPELHTGVKNFKVIGECAAPLPSHYDKDAGFLLFDLQGKQIGTAIINNNRIMPSKDFTLPQGVLIARQISLSRH